MIDNKTEPKKKRGRKPYKYDEATAEKVRLLSRYFVPQKNIAQELNISIDTLVKYYSHEMEIGKSKGIVGAYETLYKKAVIDGDRVLLMFFCKTQLGMKETSSLELTNPDGSMLPLDVTINWVEKDKSI